MFIPRGIIPPVPTFITKDLEIDYESIENAIDHHIEKGVHGLFFLGSGGEFTHLSVDERKQVAEHAVRYTNGRVPVLIGTGTTSTRETKLLNEHAAQIKADGAVVINPYYFKLGERHLFEHFNEILEEAEIPVLLYNFPAVTGQDIPAEIISDLVSRHKHLVGIKNTVDSLTHTKNILSATKEYKERFSVLIGFDDYIFSGLGLGCQGAITGTANISPDLSVTLYEAFQSEDYKTALEKQQSISELCKLYSLDQPFIGVIKEAMVQAGIKVGAQTLPPVKTGSEKQKQEIRRILKESGIL